MKKNQIFMLGIVLIAISSILFSFRSPAPQPGAVKWLQITVVESVIPGGAGRSRMITIDENGKTDEVKINNFFSLTGINFNNIRENDQTVTNEIQELTNQGWELEHISSGVFSGNQNNTNGIFLTRYLFKKVE
ncbi:MAG: hypothetical protein PHG67_14100 [Bacteroidales bacterium]|jgi:hypothetical protein|nr:hypothetical protein [Bacteroidales bacterium]HOI31733.1 hypothetical protein [Bacteroidales bacterium]